MVFSTFAHAGTWSSGGGDVFVCQEYSYLGLIQTERIYLADTYAYLHTKDGAHLVHQFGNLRSDQVLESILKTVRSQDEQMAQELTDALANFKLTPRTEVPQLNDDDIQDIPVGCEKRQLAIQGIHSGVIIYNQNYLAQLSGLERALFQLHEAYVRVTGRSSAADLIRSTKEIREKVSSVSQSQTFFEFLSCLNLNRTWYVKVNPGSLTKIVKDALAALRENDFGSFYLATTQNGAVVRSTGEKEIEIVGPLKEGDNLNLPVFRKVREAVLDYPDVELSKPALFLIGRAEYGRHVERHYLVDIQAQAQTILKMSVKCNAEEGSVSPSVPTESQYGWNCFVDAIWLTR